MLSALFVTPWCNRPKRRFQTSGRNYIILAIKIRTLKRKGKRWPVSYKLLAEGGHLRCRNTDQRRSAKADIQ